MKFNLYQLVFQENVKLEKVGCENHIISKLELIEKEIVSEYLEEQYGKLGIKNLGNKLRYNKQLNKIFGSVANNQVIIKLTENRRSFIKIFIDSYNAFKHNEIYFLILENDFGVKSNLVDKSFIRINDIEQELNMFFNCFNLKQETPKIFFIEMKGFEDFSIYNIEGYTKIEITN